MQTNILEYLEATAPRVPNKVAYSDGSYDMRFAELFLASRAIGSALCQKGYRKEAIPVLMKKHPTEIATFYGIVYAGCFYVPLDVEMPTARLQTILQTIGARCVIADDKGKKLLGNLEFSGAVYAYDELTETKVDDAVLLSVRQKHIDTDPLYIVFTSGSTGVPKGVVACHRSVIDYVEALCSELEFSEDSVFANQTPLFFDAPLKELMPVIKYGATAYLVPKKYFSFPMSLCDFLNEHRINTICWVVSALTMISSMGLLERNPPKYLRTVAFGSEVFPAKQYKLWRDALPNAKFFNLYGPTEATGMSCVWRATRELGEDEPIPIGKPFPNTDLMLIREDGSEAVGEEIGEIYLRGTCVTLGYYRDTERTKEAFVQNPLQNSYTEIVYRTGDLGYRNSYGELVFVCRKDAQIKHMGHRIELGEIEAVGAKCEGVGQVCCCYHKERSQIMLFYTGSIANEELMGYLKNQLPKYMLPTICRQLETMPLTPNGKMDRRALLDIFEKSMYSSF